MSIKAKFLSLANKAALVPLYLLTTALLRRSKVGKIAVFDCDDFDWVAKLEESTEEIQKELNALLSHRDEIPPFQIIQPDYEQLTTDKRWKTFVFYGYGTKIHDNCEKCPATVRAIEKVPGLRTAMFSIVEPKKKIPMHTGPYKGMLRYHLALKIPGDGSECGIEIDGKTFRWQEGKSLLFDDTFSHCAWNDSDETRAVLFLGIKRPLGPILNLLNTCVIELIRWSDSTTNAVENLKQFNNQQAQR